ncbi:MAG: PHP domain-containing protein [Planctomycetota bacterium]|nr:PHP domain-containing protein [Planctomycetota bacterium]
MPGDGEVRETAPDRAKRRRDLVPEARVDFHIHTIMSACASGEMTMANVVERCAFLGRERIGVTDHVMCPEHISCLLEDQIEARTVPRVGIAVYVGCELDLLAPGVPAADMGLEMPLDFVGVAANHFHLAHVRRPPSSVPEDLADYWADMALSLTELPRADVWMHPAHIGPFEEFLDDRPLTSLVLPRKLDDLFRSLAQAGIAVELRRMPPQPERAASHVEFYRLAKKAGLKFSVGSDSHHLSNLAEAWEPVASVARKAGFTHRDMWLPARLGEAAGAEATGPAP